MNDAAPGELSRAMVVVTNHGKVLATADARIGELLIYANSAWTLGAWKLYVNSVEHSLEDLAVPGPGATNRVDHYDQVIWRPVRTGTILIVR